jgi:hypothetical protein
MDLLRDFAATDPETGEPTGAVSLGTLRHLLCEVATPSSLSPQETADLFRMSGLIPPARSTLTALERVVELPVDAEDAERRAKAVGSRGATLSTFSPQDLLDVLTWSNGQ